MASTTSPKPFSSVSYSSPTSSPKQLASVPASSRTFWDVFLSFHRQDTRQNFTSHLYSTLGSLGIRTFMNDPELQTGEVVSDALIEAIKESKIYVVVFSENYASSSWCLDELAEIYKCHETKKRLIIPLFYMIDPSTVRHQTGSFKKAFKKHETGFKTGFLEKAWREQEQQLRSAVQMGKVANWRLTLTKVAGLAGYSTSGSESEIDIINQVVDQILLEINIMDMHVAQYPVGLESRVENITALMSNHAECVTSIGIYGMGGIGKTTLAKAVYNKTYRSFEGSSFLKNVRETSMTEGGLVSLQQQLINDVLKCKNIFIDNIDQGIELIRVKTYSIKVLIVIDDVDDPKLIKVLTGIFALGSIVLITTRNEDLLDSIKVEAKYKVKELNDDESLQLFTQNAFQDKDMPPIYSELSKEILKYAGGLPLALEIFGSMLSNVPEERWRMFCDKLKNGSMDVVERTLMISFDGLKSVDPRLQEVFVDIACFFIGWKKEEVVKIMETCYSFSSHNIDILKKRCLLTITNEDKLEMHDLVRDMGRNIARNEPEKRSKLWGTEDIQKLLNKQKVLLETGEISGIHLLSIADKHLESDKITD